MSFVMDLLKRICGINGRNSRRAEVIASVADDSVRESRELNDQLRGYIQTDDPFKAMVVDLHNKRTEQEMARQATDD